MITLEVCAESVTSAITAAECGASRIEFCDNMAEGGTTPSRGAVKVLGANLDIPFFPIIRPRGGDFVYSEIELEVMKEDIKYCGDAGCRGIVTGVLLPDGRVDVERSGQLVKIASSYAMEVTFHRAFDVCRDLDEALEAVIAAGCKRILTSGGENAAAEGAQRIAQLVKQAAGRISLMPGSGITPENAAGIIRKTGCREIHGTFRMRTGSESYRPVWADFMRWQTDPAKVKSVVENLKNI